MARNARFAAQRTRTDSGKQKRHTVKHNVVSDKRTRKIKILSPTCEGRKRDKKLADEQDLPPPPEETESKPKALSDE